MPDIDMTVAADDGTPLAGTLTLPDGPSPHPAVLLLHGSGPLDRDGNTPKLMMDLGRPVAEALAASGIATLRYDRRGVGSTPGDWRAYGFADNRKDAEAALRALAARPDVRTDAVGVIGHSEGAVHAMTLAARTEVRAVVLLAGFANLGEEAFRWQGRSVVSTMPLPVRLLRRPLGALGSAFLARVKKTRTDVARIAGAPVNARWMREMIVHDSRDDLAAVRGPVLAITGDKDIQVDPADLDVIERLVPGGAETHRIAGLTHVLRRVAGRPTLGAYRRVLREPVDPDLLARVASWLTLHLDAAPRATTAEGATHPS
ncbi:alpha/beta hydrolase family protein [Streptomyces tsukubensis]|uniref:Alpha/beta hydrolase n=1 Tax=Streptomyces tsukubensis TaxID=83656 RepID=A0A1V4A8X4_9ACTN|nr:alpha/beta fold hydrolase [Streptomyces tsukubensis]OON78814.1 alpha/beta hydrolase [Streptomyces tsukubensis]QFR94291.1 alpha/beta fold hydrolase [Streptomyces tsukubensis]